MQKRHCMHVILNFRIQYLGSQMQTFGNMHLEGQNTHFQIAFCTLARLLCVNLANVNCEFQFSFGTASFVVSRSWSQKRRHLMFSIHIFWTQGLHLRKNCCQFYTQAAFWYLTSLCTSKCANCNFTFEKKIFKTYQCSVMPFQLQTLNL